MRPEDQLEKQSLQPLAGTKETVRDQDKIMIVLAYLGIFSLIPLLTVKDSDYVKWHAKQGLVLFLAVIALTIVVGFIPIIGWCVGFLLPIAGLGLAIMGIVKGLGGERWRIPVVADLADKF